jgi:hypothetical protein
MGPVNFSGTVGMIGLPFQPSPKSTPHKLPADIRTVGRRHQWATFLFLIVGIAAFGLAWLLGYVPSF